MIKECDQYPKLIHTGCQIDQYENAAALYFERCGLTVERLCMVRLSNGERGPDFRIRDETFTCLLEVKHLDSPRGAPSKTTLMWQASEEYKELQDHAKATGQQAILTQEQLDLRGGLPYPKDRNTSDKDQNYAETVEEEVIKMLAQLEKERADLHFAVSISRSDQWIWTSQETEAFVKYLVDGMLSIQAGHIPTGWEFNPILHLIDSAIGLYSSRFTLQRSGGLGVSNNIELTPVEGGLELQFDTPALGLNVDSVRTVCKKAQRQIRNHVQRTGEQASRMIMIILDFDITDGYIPDYDALQSRILDSFNDVTTLVFGNKSNKLQQITGCTVFHLPRPNLPHVPSHAFDQLTTNQFEITPF